VVQEKNINTAMANKKIKLILLHTLPLLVGIFFSYLFWREKNILFWLYVFVVFILILFGKDKKSEFFVFMYGAIIGFVVETLGTQISGYQKFVSHNFLGIPAWLIIAWGYGFVLMKRIGLVISKGTPWFYKGQVIFRFRDFKIIK
jgi:hypothetical protein